MLYHKRRLFTGESYVPSQDNTCFSYKKIEMGFLRVLRFSTGNEHITGASYLLIAACQKIETAAAHKYSFAQHQ